MGADQRVSSMREQLACLLNCARNLVADKELRRVGRRLSPCAG